MSNYNTWFKRIRLSHALSRSEVVAMMKLGGMAVTGTRADGWMRSSDDNRYQTMTPLEFDIFTNGLAIWSKRHTTAI